MSLELQFFGATGEVTGSLYVLRTASHTVLLECGLIQGGAENEKRNSDPFPVPVDEIDAVILSHAHIDHSGRVPLLVKRGYDGPVYVQNATKALCEIMLPDSGYLNEKDAEWENRKRRRKGQALIQPLYTLEDAENCLKLFKGIAYGDELTVVPGLTLRFFDAGHILGAAIVEITYSNQDVSRTLVFSGDLGYRDAPVMNPPAVLPYADTVLMESTYGDRLHRSFDATMHELTEVFETARASQGNILIPAFTVGRTQDLLYLMAENFDRWHLDKWQIYLDSPMAIEATTVYSSFRHLYGARLFGPDSSLPELPNFHESRTTEESMAINEIKSGAIVIAGSGMCSGGRILHHLKNNVWRPECHLVIVGFQAYGTLGRRIVDGAETVKLYGDEYRVRIQLHTIGGLSAHGDQADLITWYGGFQNRPPVYLVHGEPEAQKALAKKMRKELDAPVFIAERGQTIQI
ncbi:MAG: MBL fold metallo-hydrolase [Gammaproteobacteria bacterium]|nr:MBL fold metallo-hydrolase [Gammaproteobacteria bacterium]MBT8110540.1 MBL fold metallo-hydrolase [Gammaproteobacteria bacterium]NND47488.1 MBL fold metallo-hydrolase [Woeseiaceae bacterium]NNL45240.1 MBL fold metallo-hydrolase [Woeseiaceae bacterium]